MIFRTIALSLFCNAALLTFSIRLYAVDLPRNQAHVELIDGQSIDGTWAGIGTSGDAKAAQLSVDGNARMVSLDSVMSISFQHEPAEAQGTEILYLADGGKLLGELTSGTAESVFATTILQESTELKFEHLAAIQLTTKAKFERAGELFLEALGSRLPGQDVLITRGIEDVKSLRGRVESLMALDASEGKESRSTMGTFNVGGRSRSFQLQKVYGIVFAAGAAKLPFYRATIEFIDGSSCSGWLESGAANEIQFKTSWNAGIVLPLGIVRKISLHSDRIVYLSDLKPMAEKSEGILSRAWPSQRDRSVSGTAISLDGKTFARGIGVRASSELTFDLGGEYACFAASIGVDDSVRPRGSVDFQVRDGDRVLYSSETMTGHDQAKDFAVSVAGVKSLTLAVGYGDDLDLSDHADWANARLLKKNSDGSSPCAQP